MRTRMIRIPRSAASGSRAHRDKEPLPAALRSGWRALSWSTLTCVLPALALFLFLRMFLVQGFLVPSASMEPTLEVGDYIVATPGIFGARLSLLGMRMPALREPRPGDVVVFRPAYNDPVVDVVKRIVAGPGDTIRMVDRTVYLNGERIAEPYAVIRGDPDEPLKMEGALGQGWHLEALPASVAPADYRPTRDTWGPLIVPDGHYFVLGDNRDRSTDSRYMGFVPRDEITAKVTFVYYSRDAMGRTGSLGFLTRARWERVGRWIH